MYVQCNVNVYAYNIFIHIICGAVTVTHIGCVVIYCELRVKVANSSVYLFKIVAICNTKRSNN